MPRGDGTGPLGKGPMGSGRMNCQGMNKGMGRNATTRPTDQKSLEKEAALLEDKAANLRKLAKENL